MKKRWSVNVFELGIVWFAGIIRGSVAFALILTVPTTECEQIASWDHQEWSPHHRSNDYYHSRGFHALLYKVQSGSLITNGTEERTFRRRKQRDGTNAEREEEAWQVQRVWLKFSETFLYLWLRESQGRTLVDEEEDENQQWDVLRVRST